MINTYLTPLVLLDGIRAVGNALGLPGGIILGVLALAVALYLRRFRSTAAAATGLFGTAASWALVALVAVGLFVVFGAWRGWLDVAPPALMEDVGELVGAIGPALRGVLDAVMDSLAGMTEGAQ
jgi:hypothetical protein